MKLPVPQLNTTKWHSQVVACDSYEGGSEAVVLCLFKASLLAPYYEINQSPDS